MPTGDPTNSFAFSYPYTAGTAGTTWPTTYYSNDYILIQAKAIAAVLESKAITRKEAREALKTLGAPFAAILA